MKSGFYCPSRDCLLLVEQINLDITKRQIFSAMLRELYRIKAFDFPSAVWVVCHEAGTFVAPLDGRVLSIDTCQRIEKLFQQHQFSSH